MPKPARLTIAMSWAVAAAVGRVVGVVAEATVVPGGVLGSLVRGEVVVVAAGAGAGAGLSGTAVPRGLSSS